jgi:hypothetical protein
VRLTAILHENLSNQSAVTVGGTFTRSIPIVSTTKIAVGLSGARLSLQSNDMRRQEKAPIMPVSLAKH